MATSENQDASGGQRLDQIVAAYLEAREQGAAPDPDAWINAHPEFGAELREFLSNWDGVSAPGKELLSLPALVPPPLVGPPALTELGDFRILRELGHGGMGIDYEAEQVSLCRRVALKVLPRASLLDERLLRRFRHEAAAVAILHHPSIEPIYAVGAEHGINFFAMQLIEGGNVAQVIAERRARAARQPSSTDLSADPLSGSTIPSRGCSANSASTVAEAESTLSSKAGRDFYRAVARLGIEVAEALDCAHQCGVIHRDIKPSNLLLGKDGHVWVSDFGLALTQDNATLTTTGGLVGTMPYMSPEQVSGNRPAIDHRSDVYGLGMTLYELVALRTAFVAEDRQGLLRQILEVEPPSPHCFDKRVPTDLETILLSAIAKNPADRYASAKDLADDLRRFLELQPIQRKRIGRWGRFTRWCRRSPVVAGLSAATLLILIAARAISASLAVAWRSKSLEAENHRREAVLRQEALENGVYNLQLSRIADVVETDLVAAERMLEDPERCPVRLRDFTWGHFQQLCRRDRLTLRGHEGEVFQTACSPDGRMLLSCGYDGTVRLWDTETGAELHRFAGRVGPIRTVAFSPTDAALAVSGGDDGVIHLWNSQTGLRRELRHAGVGSILALALSADGSTLVSGGEDQLARVYQLGSDDSPTLLRGAGAPITALDFADDGTAIAAGCCDGRVWIWDDRISRPRLVLGPQRSPCSHVRFSRSGNQLAVVDQRGIISLIDSTSTQMQVRICGHEEASSVAFASPGDHLWSASAELQPMLKCWSAKTGQPLAQLAGHTKSVYEMAFSPDGKWLVSIGNDGVAVIWDVAERQLRRKVYASTTYLRHMALDRHSRVLATSGPDGVKLWDLTSGNDLGILDQVGVAEDGLAFSPTDDLLCVARDTSVYFCEPRREGKQSELQTSLGTIVSLAFSPDGRRLALSGATGETSIVDVATRQATASLPSHAIGSMRVAWSPNGQLVATTSYYRDHAAVQVSNLLAQSKAPIETPWPSNGTGDVAFLPDGNRLAYCLQTNTRDVRLCSLATGQESLALGSTFGAAATGKLAISPDGSLLATNGPGDTIWLFDAELLRDLPVDGHKDSTTEP